MKDYRRVPEPIVAIVKNNNQNEAMEMALGLLPMDRIVRASDTVAIVPNLVSVNGWKGGGVTRPETLAAVISNMNALSPKRIVCMAGSGGAQTVDVLKVSGLDKVLDDANVEFIDLNHGPFTEIRLEHDRPNYTAVNEIYDDIDVLVSLALLKVHEEATVSLGIKNVMLSFPPADIHGLPKMKKGIHDDLHGFIEAMYKKFPIDLDIISTHTGMIGTGPSKGKAVNDQMIIAGTDPVATDVIGARMLGFKPQAVRYLYDLTRFGLGQGDISKIDIRGMKLSDAEREFTRLAYGEGFEV